MRGTVLSFTFGERLRFGWLATGFGSCGKDPFFGRLDKRTGAVLFGDGSGAGGG